MCNGDTYHPIDIADMLDFHIRNKAALTIAGAEVPNVARYGTISVNDESRIVSLGEKSGRGGGVINAGIYVASKKYFLELACISSSLEEAITAAIVDTQVFLYRDRSSPPKTFLDIGIPDDYAKAASLID